jgi:hypothetical protein
LRIFVFRGRFFDFVNDWRLCQRLATLRRQRFETLETLRLSVRDSQASTETLRRQPFEGPLLWNTVSSKLSRTHTLNDRKTGDQDDDMVVKQEILEVFFYVAISFPPKITRTHTSRYVNARGRPQLYLHARARTHVFMRTRRSVLL